MKDIHPILYRVIQCAILALVAGGIWCAFFFIKQLYSLQGACDALIGSGAVVGTAGILYWIAQSGLFNIFAYVGYVGFVRFLPHKRDFERRYWSFGDYNQAKQEARRGHIPFLIWPMLILGVVMALTGIIISAATLQPPPGQLAFLF